MNKIKKYNIRYTFNLRIQSVCTAQGKVKNK